MVRAKVALWCMRCSRDRKSRWGDEGFERERKSESGECQGREGGRRRAEVRVGEWAVKGWESTARREEGWPGGDNSWFTPFLAFLSSCHFELHVPPHLVPVRNRDEEIHDILRLLLYLLRVRVFLLLLSILVRFTLFISEWFACGARKRVFRLPHSQSCSTIPCTLILIFSQPTP